MGNDVNWNDNSIQFPRMLVELNAAGAFTDEVMEALCASMDLERHEIHTVIIRAEREWERIKENLKEDG